MASPARGRARQLSGAGRSAIAIIEVRGDLQFLDDPSPLFHAANGRSIILQDIGAICFGTWGDPGEDVVVCRVSPAVLEITCHGGEAAIRRLRDDLTQRGYGWLETTLTHEAEDAPKDICNEADDIASAQNLPLWITQARTQRTAEILLDQAQGRWEQMSSQLRQSTAEEQGRLIAQTLAWQEFGRHLVEPWKVVLCGRPNVGKSSLMNALAGFTRSIVSEVPGTTRDRVTLDTAIDGWPVQISDTAGLRDSDDTIERQGIGLAHAALQEADLAIIVLDASAPVGTDDQYLLSLPHRRRLTICHKSDLPVDQGFTAPPGSLQVSSVTGDGLAELLDAISRSLVPTQPAEGQAIPVTASQLAELERWAQLNVSR